MRPLAKRWTHFAVALQRGLSVRFKFRCTLFYSRPKDTYTGKDARVIMLDFYLVNTVLEEGGNQVRATINGTEFMLDKWLPYMMEGLPAGENTVKLELVNASGTMIPGPFNSVTRTFTVAP